MPRELSVKLTYGPLVYSRAEPYNPAEAKSLGPSLASYLEQRPEEKEELERMGARRKMYQEKILLNAFLGGLGEQAVRDLWRSRGLWVSESNFKPHGAGDIETEDYLIEVKTCRTKALCIDAVQRRKFNKEAVKAGKKLLYYAVIVDLEQKREIVPMELLRPHTDEYSFSVAAIRDVSAMILRWKRAHKRYILFDREALVCQKGINAVTLPYYFKPTS